MKSLTGRTTPLLAVLLQGCIGSCTGGDRDSTGFYTEITAEAGVDFRITVGARGDRHLVETMVGGVAWIDFDQDGDYDLYLVNGHGDSLRAARPGEDRNRLLRNEAGRSFVDVTEEAGVGDTRYGFGVAVGDFDNDGRSDLFVCNYGRNTLYHNQGDGSFADITAASGLVEEGFNICAVWFDMDRDGWLDLYVVRYLEYEPGVSKICREHGRLVYCSPVEFPGEPDLLYLNQRDGTFREIGRQAGIDRAGDFEGKGLGVVAFDYDRDGFQDLYVANDTTPNFLWRSRGDNTFVDVAAEVGVAVSADGRPQASMGIDVADVDGDGLSDIYVTNFALENNALYLQKPGTQFVESSRTVDLGSTYLPLGFGALFVDVDLDGDQDIVTANGHLDPLIESTGVHSGLTYAQKPDLYINVGSGFRAGADRAGGFFSRRVVARGLARADFDNDGDVDLLFTCLDRSVALLRNDSPDRNHALTVRLVGTESPRDGYGARVEARVGGRLQVFEYHSSRSYVSACDPRLTIGCGTARRVDGLTIHWPSGVVQRLSEIETPGAVTVTEPGPEVRGQRSEVKQEAGDQ